MSLLSVQTRSAARQIVIDQGIQAFSGAVKKLCAENFLVFMRVELGLEIGSHHRDWWTSLQVPGKDVIYLAPRDHGKALALDTSILTKRGWKTMGSVEIGDEVRHPDGGWTKVIAKSGVLRDRCSYEMSFLGTSEKITADAHHLWRTNHEEEGLAVRQSWEVAKTLRYGKGRKDLAHKIELAKPLTGEDSTLTIDPYILGAWLGDGDASVGAVHVFEEELVRYLEEKERLVQGESNKDRYRIDGLKRKLREQDLLLNKHIPRAYQGATYSQRLELLQGLMDTDGTISPQGQAEYCSVKRELAYDVWELVLGLGMKANLVKDKAKLKGRVISDRYRVCFYPSVPVCKLNRKNARNQGIGRNYWRVKEMKPVFATVQCIQVEAEDGMYLAGRSLIPTHNSHCLGRAYPIWRAKYDPWVKEIYILGADQSSAVENMDKIKDLMLSHSSLAHLVPQTRLEGINSRTEMHLMNGVTLKAKGWSSPLRGRHPQLIILDDVLNVKNSDTKEARERSKKYFREVVIPMKDKGTRNQQARGFKSQIVVIGTAQDGDDLYHDLLNNKQYVGAKQKAIIDDEKQIVLWPERYNYADLIAKQIEVGSLSFSKEYQNEPLSDDTSIFPPSLFEGLKDEELSYQQSYEGTNPVFLGADFSVPGTTDGDWTVVFAMELDQKNNMITPLHYWRAKPESIQEQLTKIEYMCQAYKVTLGYVEDNMFQKIYAQYLRQRTTLPVSGHTVTHTGKSNLQTGILSFRPLFENGRVRFPYRTNRDKLMTDHLIKEFNGVTQKKGKIGNQTFHDDSIIAWWHALSASRHAVSFSYDVM